MSLPSEVARAAIGTPSEVARAAIVTLAGEFEARAFECPSGFVYLALVKGDLGSGRSVLTRIHSECLTGDALDSLRCDCGLQLRTALRAIAAEHRGVLLYATGHEGRGIGLVNKLRAYMLQDGGADTVDANLRLGLPSDRRDYGEAAQCLSALGVSSVRLLTNNPHKQEGLRRGGIEVEEMVALPTSGHVRNSRYLSTKQVRLGHVSPAGAPLESEVGPAVDVMPLLGPVSAPESRPYVVLKYAQTIDGRIATRTGDARWISGEAERRVSHGFRAACDAVLVGRGTVVVDDPQLTVRMVTGFSPLRVVLDSTLRVPDDARVLQPDARTAIVTTGQSSPERRLALQARGLGVHVVEKGPRGVDLTAALRTLRDLGVRSLLVEGGAQVITSFLAERLVDRFVVSISPTIVGAGTEAVGDLNVTRIANALRLTNTTLHTVGDDLLVAADVPAQAATPPEAA